MSLIYCPECGHEISNAAIACPNCGRPINAVPTVDPVVVTPPPRREGFPPWAIIPIGLAGLAFIFFLIYAMSGPDETADSNLNVNVNARRTSTRSVDTDRTDVDTTVPSGSTVTVPPSAPPTDVQTVTVPGSQTTVPAGVDKGRVVIDAKVASRTGTPQAVRNERFYLLDKDLETILDEAGVEPIEGQTLSNSLGLSVLYPNRYGDFYRNALAAIRKHIKYSGTTDGSGKAQLANIEPDSYYLFGITKASGGFAIWSNPVSIQAGDNVLNLSPQQITQMETNSLNLSPQRMNELADNS